MNLRGLALIAATVLIGCSDEDENYNETVAFPTKADIWTSMLAGVLEVGGTAEGARNAGGKTRTVRMKVRFGGGGLNCEVKLAMSATIDGRTANYEIVLPEGALEHSATLNMGDKTEGAARLKLMLVESPCGPVGIDLDQSTVTFAS